MQDDQNPQPQPQPEPQPQPPVAPTPAPTQPYAPQGTPYTMPPKPKSKTGLIIGIVAGAIALLVVGGLFIVFALSSVSNYANSDKSTTQAAPERSETPERRNNTITATSFTNMNSVCDGSSILNAAELAKPYKVAAFSKANDSRSWSSVSLKYNAEYAASYDAFEQASVVACVKEDTGSREKVNICEFTSAGEDTSIDYYATSYTLSVYEAKTGKKIEDLGSVGAPATSCPMFASYDKSDPKLVAQPDTATIDAKLAAFAL